MDSFSGGFPTSRSHAPKTPFIEGFIRSSSSAHVEVARGARKVIEPINIQSLMTCAPVLTQMFLDQM